MNVKKFFFYFLISLTLLLLPYLFKQKIIGWLNNHNDLDNHIINYNNPQYTRIGKYPPLFYQIARQINFLTPKYALYFTMIISLAISITILALQTKEPLYYLLLIYSSYFIFRSLIEQHYALIFSLLPCIISILYLRKNNYWMGSLFAFLAFSSYYMSLAPILLYFMCKNLKQFLIGIIALIITLLFCLNLRSSLISDLNIISYGILSISIILLMLTTLNFQTTLITNKRFLLLYLFSELTLFILVYLNIVGKYYANKLGFYFIIPISLVNSNQNIKIDSFIKILIIAFALVSLNLFFLSSQI